MKKPFPYMGWIFFLVFIGCNSSTDPGPGTESPSYVYTPDVGTLEVLAGSSIDFSVTITGASTFSTEWRVDDQVVSQASSFQFQAAVVGVYVVAVETVFAGESVSRQWTLRVVEDADTLPPVVPSVVVGEGHGPGTVRLSWNAVAGSAFPIDSYEVGCSFQGSLATENWELADILISIPATTGIGYVRELTSEDGMIPGVQAWFGVRARDAHGQLSPLPASSAHLISFPWVLEGYVQDDQGAPMASVLIRFETPLGSTNIASGADGSFRSEAISSVDSVRIVARSIDPDYYSFTTPFLYAQASASPYEITLIGKYGADATCNANGGDFLAYLRTMSRSDDQHGGILHKWTAYPIKIYIPDFVREDGIDFGSLCLNAMDYWNSDVGEILFTTASGEADADVVISYRDDIPGANGQVVLLAPQGVLGAVTPVQMRLDIDKNLSGGDGIDTGLAIQGVFLHEFGHVQGLYDHSSCDGYRLMNFGSGTAAFKPETLQPIADDETNAVRCLRYLGDGVDMSHYSDD